MSSENEVGKGNNKKYSMRHFSTAGPILPKLVWENKMCDSVSVGLETTTSPNGCQPSASQPCTGGKLAHLETKAVSSTPMIMIYVVFGVILFGLILFMSLNATTIKKAKTKNVMNLPAKTNLGLSFK